MNRSRDDSTEPAYLAGTGNDFDIGSGFMQQSGRFKRALTTADHQHFPAGELVEVDVLRSMRRERRGQVVKFGWTPGE